MTALAPMPDAERSNHTIDAFLPLLALIPDGARTALDVGCGEGFASRALAARGLSVTGIDRDVPSLEAARAQASDRITYVEADALTADIAAVDVITALAVMHHLPLDQGLARVRDLLNPGGVLLIVGCAASTMPRDLGWELAGVVAHQVGRLTHRTWEHPSPTLWPPPVTYDEVRDAAARLLPGSTFRRRAAWRYTLTWIKPGARPGSEASLEAP